MVETLKEKDIPAVVKIWNEAFPDLPFSLPAFKRQVLPGIQSHTNGCFVARDNSGVVGFALATTTQIPYTGRTPEFPGCIPAIAVARKARRKGIGTRLLKKAESYLLGRGVKKIRPGYPTYLRDTILSLIGVDTRWNGAVRFFETFGYAPKGVLDSMVLNLDGWQPTPELLDKIKLLPDNIEFGPLNDKDMAIFIKFMRQEFPGSWYDQFNYLYRIGLLKPADVLIMEEQKNLSGFAGPFPVGENGDTCGIGLGVAGRLRGKGLGLALLYHLVRMVKEKGGKRITLFGAVDKINYYGKAGFLPGPVWLVMEKDVKL